MQKKILLIIVFFSFMYGIKAQGVPEQVYVSKPGKIALLGIYNNKVFIANSNQLQTTIDYQLGTVIFKLDVAKLESGVGILDTAIKAIYPPVFQFKGKLKIVAEGEPEEININGYTRKNFPIKGVIALNGIEKDVTLNGELIRLAHSGNVGSQLIINFDIHKEDFKLFEGINGIYETFHIEISQPLLINWKN